MNAKELILKKINADANWVDIYCSSLMIGESLESIGIFMMDPDIVKVCNNYVSSIFDKKQNYNKKKYLNELIEKTSNGELKSKYQKLLDKVNIAEELQFLGKMLKINQGIPTNTSDLYSYIKSIEKYIESVINTDVYEVLDQIDFTKNWINFNLIDFIKNPRDAEDFIFLYEKHKRTINILDIINSVPHFKAMFSSIALNKDILNSLSVRNSIEDIVLNSLPHNYNKGKSDITSKLSSTEVSDIKNGINKLLINNWIISKKLSIPDIKITGINKPIITIDSVEKINKLKSYIDDYAIPMLKDKLQDNIFIQSLTYGVKQDKKNTIKSTFWKLPFNMVQIDNNPKVKSLYENCLNAFNNLRYTKVRGIDINIVDLFYLYNMIVNDDKFGSTSLTRIFEDLIAQEDNEDLFVYDFNNWIDKQDPVILAEQFLNEIKREPIENTNNQITIDNVNDNIEETVIGEEPVFKVHDNTNNIVTDYYDTKLSNESKLIALVKTSNIPGLHVVYDSDLVNEDNTTRLAKGFIRNGEIFINADRATDDTIIHEFGHLYLADAKVKHADLYYALLTDVMQTDTWKRMRNMDEYKNKVGSDFNEEVLATLISNYYASKRIDSPFMENDAIEDTLVLRALTLVSPEFKEFIVSDVLPSLSDTFISNYKENQKIATIKNKLVKQEIIKEICK